MRIAIGQIAHETNTFCAASTAVEDFKAWEWVHVDEIVRRHRGVDDYLGGMLNAGERLGITILPIFSAFAYPSGTITRATYEALRIVSAPADVRQISRKSIRTLC